MNRGDKDENRLTSAVQQAQPNGMPFLKAILHELSSAQSLWMATVGAHMPSSRRLETGEPFLKGVVTFLFQRPPSLVSDWEALSAVAAAAKNGGNPPLTNHTPDEHGGP